MKAKLVSELQAGRIAGPFQTLPHPDLKISPLGVVPKRQEGQFRLIHHLSHPRASGLSVNDGIPKEYTAVFLCRHRKCSCTYKETRSWLFYG